LAEVDSFTFSSKTDASDVPLLTSIIYETLRLHSSPFSIRRSIVKEPFILNGETEILPKENVIVVPRAVHLDQGVWGEDYAVWNPKRFYDAPASLTNNASKMREVRAFGGGSSMVRRPLALNSSALFTSLIIA
jgi:cytochrome P450